MTDADRDLAAAIARKLSDCGTAEPDAAAREVIAIIRGHGWRHVIVPPPAPRGSGLPEDPGVADLVARTRAQLEQHHEEAS